MPKKKNADKAKPKKAKKPAAKKSKELAVKQAAPPAPKLTDQDIDEFLFGSDTKLTEPQRLMFKKTAMAWNLNPFKREIYAIPFGNNFSIVVGYEVYLKRAMATRMLDGWSVACEGSIQNKSLKAVVTIHRKDWKEPFVHEAYWIEYNQDNRMWKSKPITMIKKVAIAQAFRLCFPSEMAGLPYVAEEIHDDANGSVTRVDVELPAEDQKQIPNEEKIEIDEKIKTAKEALGWDDNYLQEYVTYCMGTKVEKLDYTQKGNLVKALNKEIDLINSKEAASGNPSNG